MTRLTINGQTVTATPGQSIIEVASQAQITIPALCYHPDLSAVGSCRLCLVEVDGQATPVAACTTPVAADMVVHTESPELAESRKFVLEILLADYTPGPDPLEQDNEFLQWVRQYGVRWPADRPAAPRYQADSDPNPFIRVDSTSASSARAAYGRATRCRDGLSGAWPGAGPRRKLWRAGDHHAGGPVRIVRRLRGRLSDRGLVDRFALVAAPDAERQVRTTCGYCGVGCQFSLHVRDERMSA